MRLKTTIVLVLCLSPVMPIYAGADGPREMVPGMTKNEIMRMMGPPDAVRLERNSVVCLTYDKPEPRLWSRLFGDRTKLIALKSNKLIEEATIRSESVRFYCSWIAARWDRPMSHPLTCGHPGSRC